MYFSNNFYKERGPGRKHGFGIPALYTIQNKKHVLGKDIHYITYIHSSHCLSSTTSSLYFFLKEV